MIKILQALFRSRLSTTSLYLKKEPVCRHLSVSAELLAFSNYRVPTKFRKWKTKEEENTKTETETETQKVLNDEEEIDKLIKQNLSLPIGAQQVYVIQPFIKWGIKKKRNTTPQLQLLEAVTLIKTLRQWKVVGETIVSLQYIRGNTVFGSGVLKTLEKTIKSNDKVTAVFVSLNTLNIEQQKRLEKVFGVKVFDRYSIIMHIFKEHAQTKEAKLQVQLAELPYLWTVLDEFGRGMEDKLGISFNYLGGSGPKSLAERREMFKKRMGKLKREIAELRSQRTQFREQRQKNEIPVVAVIGYTNAGKTSLIKALTGKKSLEPQDYLFATLDVTSHLGELPSGLKAFFVDTLGFISDIPTYLIESFVATLEDAAMAQLIIHVRDISHPDTVAQNDNVIATLQSLNIPEKTMENIITVGNKIDLLEKSKLEDFKDLICVSCSDLTGINVLRQEIERKIVQLSGKIQLVIKVKSGGPEYFWLHEMATVVRETPDVDNNDFMFVETIISSSALAKFKHDFIKNPKR